MGFFQDIFKQKNKLYSQPRAGIGTSCIAMHNRRYADMVLDFVVEQIFNCIDTIDIYQNGNYIIEDARVANARAIITLHFREIFWDMFNKGYFVLLIRGDEFEYLPAKYISKMGDDGYVTTELEGRVEARRGDCPSLDTRSGEGRYCDSSLRASCSRGVAPKDGGRLACRG